MEGVKFLPHQQEAIEKLKSGSILCGGTGTGKSITALGYFLIKECEGVQWTKGGEIDVTVAPRDLYIITTARKRDTGEWVDECNRFDMNDISIVIDSWNNMHKYETVEDAFFIFDEQRVVGSGSWVRCFYKITKSNHWILLTATPGDSWLDYIPVFVANGFYKNRTEFLKRHAVFNRYSKYPKIDKWLEPGYLEFLRRKITIVMEYKKNTIQHWNTLEAGYDIQLYKTISENRWDPWKEQPIPDISGTCYLMRKAVNSHPSRIEIVRRILEKHPKAIIFYNFDYELEILRTLENYGNIEVSEWNGHYHDDIPKSDRWAYLVQYTAGCEGWNCITTDTIIFFSQSYSYKQMTQAAGRVDRLNTPYTDLYYYVIRSSAPIDIAIGRALKGKRNFNEKLFITKSGL